MTSVDYAEAVEHVVSRLNASKAPHPVRARRLGQWVSEFWRDQGVEFSSYWHQDREVLAVMVMVRDHPDVIERTGQADGRGCHELLLWTRTMARHHSPEEKAKRQAARDEKQQAWLESKRNRAES